MSIESLCTFQTQSHRLNDVFCTKLTEYAQALELKDKEASIGVLGAILSEASILCAEEQIVRIKELIFLLTEDILSTSTIAKYYDLDITPPAVQSYKTELPAQSTSKHKRISFRELLRNSKTRVLTLSNSKTYDGMIVLGGKFAEPEVSDFPERYLLSILILDGKLKRLRSLKRFSPTSAESLITELRQEFGEFIIKT